MKNEKVILSLLVLLPIFVACQPTAEDANSDAATTDTEMVEASTRVPFPSYNSQIAPPPDWTGRVFSLSQDYPEALPTGESMPWMEYDFKTQPKEYLMAAREYIFEGNINRGNDENGNSLDWVVQSNPVRTWYHMPWREYGDHGREFTHGMTLEFPAAPHTLDPAQQNVHYTYAVAMYNPLAGYMAGQVWPSADQGPVFEKANFPEGALVTKLLMTTAPESEMPSIAGAYEWQSSVYSSPDAVKLGDPREIAPVRLMQIDIAIKDSRAEETSWVFGALVYDHTVEGDSPWDKMIPLGLMWGNDPELTADMKDAEPKQSIVFYDRQDHPMTAAQRPHGAPPNVNVYEHLGCHGRLAGPADNPKSACLSCHQAAQHPATPGWPQGTMEQCDDPALNGHLWTNTAAGDVFQQCTVETYALDYSMELSTGVQNYFLSNGQDISCDDPSTPEEEPSHAVRRYETASTG